MALVTAEQDGWRLDRIVASLPSVGSRARARKALETGKITVNGRVALADEGGVAIAEGTAVAFDPNRRGPSPKAVKLRTALQRAGIRILHADDAVVAVSKPSGMLTDTATWAQRREEISLRQHLNRWLVAQGDQALPAHRIDRDTTGVVLFARNPDAEANVREQFRARTPRRVYRAFVHGVPTPAEGQWSHWMYWDKQANIQRQGRVEGSTQGTCQYRVIQRHGHVAELELELVTGRRNQIRLSAMLEGHPLVGERQYVPRRWSPPPRPKMARQALHAYRLEVRHPTSGDLLVVQAPLPDDFQRLRGGPPKKKKKSKKTGRTRR